MQAFLHEQSESRARRLHAAVVGAAVGLTVASAGAYAFTGARSPGPQAQRDGPSRSFGAADSSPRGTGRRPEHGQTTNRGIGPRTRGILVVKGLEAYAFRRAGEDGAPFR